jgi:hypothetical protein
MRQHSVFFFRYVENSTIYVKSVLVLARVLYSSLQCLLDTLSAATNILQAVIDMVAETRAAIQCKVSVIVVRY